jgi:FkbM family methyltransferase
LRDYTAGRNTIHVSAVNSIARRWADAARNFARRRGVDFGRFNPYGSVEAYLPRLFDEYGIHCVLDVGAHTGEYAQKLRRAGYKDLIISFEPASDSFRALQNLSKGCKNWKVYNLALGSKDGSVDLNIFPDTVLNSVLPPSELALRRFGENARATRTERVRMRRLDSVLPELLEGLPDVGVYLKIDTQGHDMEVVKGAREVLPVIRALQSEMSIGALQEGAPNYLDAIRMLEELGYRSSAMFPVLQTEGSVLAEFDLVMVRPSARNPPGAGTR